jgi:hypothetical protein
MSRLPIDESPTSFFFSGPGTKAGRAVGVACGPSSLAVFSESILSLAKIPSGRDEGMIIELESSFATILREGGGIR